MGPAFTRKYNTLLVTGTTAIRIPIIKRAAVDFAVSADWTPAAGDVKINVDGAAPANVTNLPTAVASGNGAYWEFILTAAELSCKQAIVTIVDAATKVVEDQSFIVETFGHASAMYQMDFSAAAFAITSNIKKNQALSKFVFQMTDSTNHLPATGKTVSVTRSIDGASFAAGTLSSVTELSDGDYYVDWAAADLNGNVIVLKATATGCDTTQERIITQP